MARSHRNNDVSSKTYLCSPDIKWAVETFGIILVDQNTSTVCSLGYPEAAVWDLINRGFSYEKTVNMLRFIADIEIGEAENLLLGNINKWVEAGFLIKVKRHG